MNEVDREKISYSIGTQGKTRNESSDYKNYNNNEKNLDKQENDFEINNSNKIPVFYSILRFLML